MSLTARDLAHIAMMLALITILSLIPGIPLGFIPVPITLQTLGIMLTGSLLGAYRGTLTVILFFIMGIFTPVFSGGTTLIPVLAGPTAGYVVVWPLTTLLIGVGLSLLPKKRKWLTFIIIWLGGVLLIDTMGALWLAYSTKKTLLDTLWANLAFIPGDSLKALLATIITLSFQSLLPKKKSA